MRKCANYSAPRSDQLSPDSYCDHAAILATSSPMEQLVVCAVNMSVVVMVADTTGDADYDGADIVIYCPLSSVFADFARRVPSGLCPISVRACKIPPYPLPLLVAPCQLPHLLEHLWAPAMDACSRLVMV